MNIGAIILAAGASTRMGASKQMLQINGEYLLTGTIRTVQEAGLEHIVVVLGAREAMHRKIISNHHVDVVINDRWETGMGSSIKAGLQQLLSTEPKKDAAIFFVCDQPMLTRDVVSRIVSTFETVSKPIVASRYADSAGVPVLFARSYFAKLAAIPDDHGAKIIIKQNPADVIEVAFPGGDIDIDTKEDYERFVRK